VSPIPWRRRQEADQTASDADQTAADRDQTASETDQSLSDRDQAASEVDQRVSDREQALADQQLKALSPGDASGLHAYEKAQSQRGAGTMARAASATVRAQVAFERDEQANRREENARHRDEIAAERDRSAAGADEVAGQLAWAVEEPDGKTRAALEAAAHVRSRAAAARTRAALEREAAARDRDESARDRELLRAEIKRSQLDGLTGAYGREMGEVLLRHEVQRAERSHGSLALTLVDIGRPKGANYSDGDPAGDALLCEVFEALRATLRPYDPVVRWRVNQFVCAAAELESQNAAHMIEDLPTTLATLHPSVTASLVTFEENDSLTTLIERAAVALSEQDRDR
jgi:diguanylate cyclase (GGDEF)-like protein